MPETTTFSGRLAKNSIAGLLRYAVTIPILLAVTPFILHHLGSELYGVWALFGIVTAYADLSDLGIASSLIRFVARYIAEEDKQAVNRSVSTVLFIYLATGGAVAAVILFGGRFLIEGVFKIPAAFADEAIFVVFGATTAFFISLLAGTFGSLIQGLQRMDLWNARLVAYTILDSAGAVVVLSMGYGLRGLVINRIFACLVIGLINWWTAQVIMPDLKVGLSYFSMQSVREIIGYSVNILVSKIARMAREPLSRTIILRITSLTGMTYFDLGARIANQARGLFVAMLIPLLPAASEIQTVGGNQATRRLFYRSTRYVLFAILPVFGGLFVLAKPIINLWIGPEYGPVIITMQALLVAHFFAVLSSPAFTIMEGVGLARVSAVTSVVSAILNIVFCIVLGIQWGYPGVVAGYCLSLLVTSVVTLALFHHKLDVPLVETLRAIPFRVVIVNVCAMIVSGLLATYTAMPGLVALLVSGSVYMVICIVGTLAFGCLEQEEMNTVRRLWSFLPIKLPLT